MKLFLCGDVMTGRGIDQIQSHSCPPRIYESFIENALDYVTLAEEKSGPISRPVDFAYLWGDALAELDRAKPDVRIINLETVMTLSNQWVPKGINYRMHPKNVACLLEAKIDCCSLANNHILDWGEEGLKETIETLRTAGIQCAGAGGNKKEAQLPAIIPVASKGRVLVFSFGMATSGIPPNWAATERSAGMNFLWDFSLETIQWIREEVRKIKKLGDIAIASIHWGPNWGYKISHEEIQFAHQLIDEAEIDLIHGHSSHHPKAIDVYRGKLILYGCGDFIDDYEGISGYEAFRSDLGFMYFLTVDDELGHLKSLELVPTQIRRFQVKRAALNDTKWIQDVLNREGKIFKTSFDLSEDRNVLFMRWKGFRG